MSHDEVFHQIGVPMINIEYLKNKYEGVQYFTRLRYCTCCFKVLGEIQLTVPETLPHLTLQALTRSVPYNVRSRKVEKLLEKYL